MHIDTDRYTPAQLRAAAKVLNALADFREAAPELPCDLEPIVVTSVPAGTFTTPVPPTTASIATAPGGFTQSANSDHAAALAIIPPPPSSPTIPVPPPATVPVSASNVVPVAPTVPPSVSTDNQPASKWPGAAAALAALAAGQPAYDSTGLRYDARIHTGGENKLNDDGTWRQKRGVNSLLVASVTAELRAAPAAAPVPPPPAPAAVAVPPPPAPVSLPAAGSMPVSLPTPSLQPEPVAATVPAPTAPAVGTVPAAPAPVSNGPTFTQLFMQANRYAVEGRYTMDQLMQAVTLCGGNGLESLQGNAPLIAAVWNHMEMTVGASPRAF